MVNFGEILNKWEKQNAGAGTRGKASNPSYDWPDSDDSYDKDTVSKENINGKSSERKEILKQRRFRLLRKKPDASIDLHGLTCQEALTALEHFFMNSKNSGFEKVLIIHGKGNHSNSISHNGTGAVSPFIGEGILKELSRQFIESCPLAGESGPCPAREGGSGATWVLLKQYRE